MKKNKKAIIGLIIVILIQTVVFIIAGMNKSYIHMDEAYSMGLASYDKVEIQDNEDFYNTWHDKEYYKDYMVVNDDEVGQYSQVYENQKNDVHPPLYYLLLRFAMGFSVNNYSVWPGIIVNIVIFTFVTIFIYLIVSKLLKDHNKAEEKALFITLMASIVFSSITNVIYIRMYALSTLNIVITTYLHLKLLDSDKVNYKLLFAISLSALVGSLTHYYYLFYLAMLFIMFAVKYIREKRYKELICYILAMCCAAVISLIIFPYSIKHMFFGYRGQGVISNLLNVPKFISSIGLYIGIISLHGFNNALPIIVIAILGIIIYKKVKKIKLVESKNKYIKYITLPTLFYFILVAIASPWIELRYVLPICGLIFILTMYIIYVLLSNIENGKYINKVIIGISLVILLMPILTSQVAKAIPNLNYTAEPEEMFSDKKEIVQKLSGELNVPTLYMFNSSNNRFLDDIYLFSIIDESYIAKDMECNEKNVKEVMSGKDTSKGIVVFINGGQENDDLLEVIKKALKLETTTYLKRLNACDVYLVK